MSAPIRSLIHNNQGKFAERKWVFITNANEEVTKYETMATMHHFSRRYFRDFLRDRNVKAMNL